MNFFEREEMKEKIKKIILECRGQENAITAQEITDLIGERNTGLTNPVTRTEIRNLIIEDKIPIASCSQGYFIPKTEEEAIVYDNNLRSRAREIARRRNKFWDAYEEFMLRSGEKMYVELKDNELKIYKGEEAIQKLRKKRR